MALRPADLPELDRLLSSMEQVRTDDFESGFIAESPQKLRRIHQYFAAIHGQAAYPAVRCNAPEFSAVIDAKRQLHPCFFISGPPGSVVRDDFVSALNGEAMTALRLAIRAGERPECATCVCSMWRNPETVGTWRAA